MITFVKSLFCASGAVLLMSSPVLAQNQAAMVELPHLGVGLTVIGAAYGIGKLASSAYDGMSRQPEVSGNIQTAMIIAAALIEGFTFFALYICWTA